MEHSASSTSSQVDTQSPLSVVCSACRAGPFSYEGFRQAIAEGHYNDTTGYCYTTTWHEISQSVRNEACSWCRIIIRTRDGLTPDKFPAADAENVEIRFQISVSKMWNGAHIYLNGDKSVTYTIYANPGDNAVEEIGTKVAAISEEPYADYAKVLECIKECSNHEHCPAIEETYLPTRVIDCSDPAKPRLVETRRQIRGHYCALSYVWGPNQPQKTTTSNIATYVREGINVPLPQTIADAIFVTNKLGIRYLWVDALCIIQDSSEDKDNELGIMSHIYRDAYLTISALSAFRADHGFLPDKRPPDVLPFYLANRSMHPGQMMLHYSIPRRLPGRNKYQTVVMHRTLDKRGWCMQESMLSPRRLIFQPPNLSYKCRSFAEQDLSRPPPLGRGHRNQLPIPVNDHILFSINSDRDNARAPDVNEAGDNELRELWWRTLSDYSERKITVPSDKFVALASIVEVFQSLLNDQYVAGLWRRNILYDLLWQVWPPMGPDETHLPRPADYRAPTWSWASVDGKLDFAYSHPPASAACYEAEVVACEVTPKISTLPFGELSSASLTMRVKIHPLMRNGGKCMFIEQKGTSSGNRLVRSSRSWLWTPPLGNCLEASSFSVDGLTEEEQVEKRIRGFRFDCLEGTEQDCQMEFYVVILRAGRKWRNQGDWMHGLLVIPVDGEVDQYRRVARLDLGYNFEWQDWFDAMPLKTVTLI